MSACDENHSTLGDRTVKVLEVNYNNCAVNQIQQTLFNSFCWHCAKNNNQRERGNAFQFNNSVSPTDRQTHQPTERQQSKPYHPLYLYVCLFSNQLHRWAKWIGLWEIRIHRKWIIRVGWVKAIQRDYPITIDRGIELNFSDKSDDKINRTEIIEWQN